jgi:hypothetical protein
MSRRAMVLAILLAPAVIATSVAFAGLNTQASLKSVRTATDHLRNPAVAEALGYTLKLPELSGATCIAQPGVGAMGIHLVNTNLLDATIHPSAPEVLVYAPRANGGMKLVAVEYVVFQEAWDKAKSAPQGEHAAAPKLFGRSFEFTGSPNRYGLPPFYALHAWAWLKNPIGPFAPWNPKVTCASTQRRTPVS